MFAITKLQKLTKQSTTAGTTSNTTPQIAFDLVTVMKASQAIAREIELAQLLRSLMQILIESAGAQIGFLILEDSCPTLALTPFPPLKVLSLSVFASGLGQKV